MPAEAPPAAPAGVTIVEGNTPGLPSASPREIKVSEMSRSPQPERKPKAAPAAAPATEPPKPVEAPAPKSKSAKDKMIDNLRGKAKDNAGNPIQQEPEPAAAPPEGAPAAEPAPAAADPKKDKPNPWKLKEEWENRAKTAEQKLVDAEKRAIPEATWKDTQEQLKKAQDRLKELEGEIRYVDYTKSEEFKTKYQQPYEQAWGRAMNELGELTVDDGNGTQRALQAADILDLVNLPLPKAKALADEKFGAFASDVMAHRKEIRKLYDEQSAALDQAKKDATTTMQQREQQANEQRQKMSTEIMTEWKTANDQVAADPKYGRYFVPTDGDPEGNQRLAKGFELVDRAFTENQMDPKLTPQQRRDVIRRHSAVRNRAAAFGRLVHWKNSLESQVKALTEELAQYKGSEPGAGGRVDKTEPAAPTTAMGRMQAELRKKMKPM